MSRRVASWVFFVAVSSLIGCKQGTQSMGRADPLCRGYTATLIVRNGHHYVHVQLPDGHSVVVNVDGLPLDGGPLVACPCEEDECRDMCRAVAPELVLPDTACLFPPPDAGVPTDTAVPDAGVSPDASASPDAWLRPDGGRL